MIIITREYLSNSDQILTYSTRIMGPLIWPKTYNTVINFPVSVYQYLVRGRASYKALTSHIVLDTLWKIEHTYTYKVIFLSPVLEEIKALILGLYKYISYFYVII